LGGSKKFIKALEDTTSRRYAGNVATNSRAERELHKYKISNVGEQ